MYEHAPPGYICPFCLVAQGVESEHVLTLRSDLVYQDRLVSAFIGASQWPGTPGHVLIIPNAHVENLYALPDELALPLQRLTRAVALAMKTAYRCAGTSTRQHNEPAGNQDVWHYHLHVFPRYPADNLYSTEKRLMAPTARARYAALLRPLLQL